MTLAKAAPALCLAWLLQRRLSGRWLLAALVVAGLRALRAFIAQKLHPGTAQQRRRCLNPGLGPADFEERFLGDAERLQGRRFDFVVLGSGSAGCACAARLARSQAKASVLLVEAGGEAHRSALVRIPRRAFGAWQSEIDWGFRTTPQKHLLPPGRVIDLERGKTTGGSSAINYNLWVRGAAEDYDRWERRFGCTGWGYKDVLPHFEAVEQAVSVAPLFPPAAEAQDFVEACQALGAEAVADYNAASLPWGAGVAQMSAGKQGMRQDAFSAFIEPALRECPNLEVVSESFCRRVLFEDGTLEAKGVELELRCGQRVEVHCDKEVILSCGALQTPQLLQLSGLGDEELLRSLGIPCLRHLPEIGRNLSDHPILPLGFKVKAEAQLCGSGRSQDACGTHAAYFWRSGTGSAERKSADLETLLNSRIQPSLYPKMTVLQLQRWFSRTPDYRSSPLFGWLAEWAQLWGCVKEQTPSHCTQMARMMELVTVVNHPASRGSVKLRSKDPHEPPLVDPNYLAEEEDVAAMLAALKRVRAMVEQPSLQKYFDGFVVKPPEDEAAQRSFVRRQLRTTWHYSCTTRMGRASDSVCDPRGRVYGVGKLRVADAGLMPEVVGGNINAACMMIGDRIGFFINEDHGETRAGI